MKSTLFRIWSRVKAEVYLAWLCFVGLVSCLPKAEAPTVTESVTAAVNMVDAAVATAMVADDPSLSELQEVWYPRVQKVNKAMAFVRAGKNICPVLPELRELAVAVKCQPCVRAVDAVQKDLQCQ